MYATDRKGSRKLWNHRAISLMSNQSITYAYITLEIMNTNATKLTDALVSWLMRNQRQYDNDEVDFNFPESTSGFFARVALVWIKQALISFAFMYMVRPRVRRCCEMLLSWLML